MFKGLYLNKMHMHASDYCSVRLARNVPVAPLQNTRSRGRSWIPVQGAELISSHSFLIGHMADPRHTYSRFRIES